MEDPGRIKHYTIDRELAKSNICSVYQATEEELRRPVLIKKLHPQMAREEDIRSRFLREAQVCALLNHENIVAIYSYHADPELSMLVLEFVEGRNLGELTSQVGIVDWKISLIILHEVLSGLAYAHSKGVVHRDIKPDNILISNEGSVKITDFGLATLEDAPKLTRQGQVVGTPAYLPPEGLTGAKIDHRSDLFSLGATIYELTTGSSPFQGENFSETMSKILKLNPQPPSELVEGVPPGFDQILQKMMEKQAAQRYSTAEHALSDVTNLSARLNIPLDKQIVKEFLSTIPLPTDLEKSTSSSVGISAGSKPVLSSSLVQSIPPEAVRERRKKSWIRYLMPLGLVLMAVVVIKFAFFPNDPVDPSVNQPADSSETLLSNLTDSLKVEIIPEDSSLGQGQQLDRAPQPVTPIKPETAVVNNSDTEAAIETPVERQTTASDSILTSDNSPNQGPIDDLRLEPGRVRLTTKQWANVFVDDESYGQTPLVKPIELPPGDHRLMLTNSAFPAPVFITLQIKPDKELDIDVDLTKYFATFRILSVKPWAEILIDDTPYGLTPRARPIFLPFGKHRVELRNASFPTWRKEFTVGIENPTVEINVDLQVPRTDQP